jgi:acyl carrier protein
MYDSLLNDFFNHLVESATQKAAEKTAEVLVDGIFDSFQGSSSSSTVPIITNNKSKGKIEKIWLDYDTQQDSERGILIHLNFNVDNLKDVKCRAVAYFYFKNGAALKDLNSSYYSADGQVCAGKDFTPGYEGSIYKDFMLFMPYDELHVSEGKHELKFHINLYEQVTKSEIARSNDYQFRCTYLDNQPKGTFNKTWVDFDVVEAGIRGMRIHFNFQVDNVKNSKCQATAFFYSDDGNHLKDNNKNYCSTSGQVCTSDDFTPGYKNSLYEDLSLFMPYDELHLGGDHGLTFRIRLFDRSKQTDIAWSEDYYFFYFVDGEITIGEEEAIDTMSVLQVLIARQLGIEASEISPETNFVELLGTSLSKSKKIISSIEKNLNFKFNYDDPDEIGVLEELDTLEALTLFVIFKRKLPQLAQNPVPISTEVEKVVIPCPKCAQKLRAPGNRGKLTLTCPKCKHSWQWVPI